MHAAHVLQSVSTLGERLIAVMALVWLEAQVDRLYVPL